MPQSNPKSRAWVFTLNNWTQEELDAIVANQPKFQYAIIGKEVGEQGTPHLQGYVYVGKNPVRMGTLKGIVGNRAHLEIAKGTVEHNYNYCSKEGDFMEYGTRPLFQSEKGMKEKERYANAYKRAREGDLEAIEPDLLVRHYGTFKRIRMDAVAERELVDTEERMEWYWGPSGTGKSRKARSENPDAYLKMCNKWWDSYVDQEVVLIEDFDVKHAVLVHHLKIWADRYPFLAEVKGGSVKIRPKRIIVTSNYHPRDIWTEATDLEPILRRFHVTHFN